MFEWFMNLTVANKIAVAAIGVTVSLATLSGLFKFLKWLFGKKGKVVIKVSLDKNDAPKRWVIFYISKTGEKKITLTELQARQDGKKWVTIVSKALSGPNLSGVELPLQLGEGDSRKPKIPVETFKCIFSKQESLNSPCQISFRFKSLEDKFYHGNKAVEM